MGSTSNLPGVERAILLASPKGEGINLRPPNQTTQEVSVSCWRHQADILIKDQCMYQAQVGDDVVFVDHNHFEEF